MPPASRKRRSQPTENSDSQNASPPHRRKLSQQTQSQLQRHGGNSFSQNAIRSPRATTAEEAEGDEVDTGDDFGGAGHGEANKDRLVKKFVRLALASEYTRQPLRRADITSKVLGSQNRMFKEVFEQSQKELRRVFGMELVELPMREKTKLSQRRAAQNTDKGPTSSKKYLLTTVLPESFRKPETVHPHGFKEQTYTGLVTMIVSLIYLNGGVLPENKLNRYLLRMNADENTPTEKTEKVITAMDKQGYVVKQKDDMGGGGYDYYLGPRAKVEIGSDGVLAMLRTVYGVTAPEDLEKRLKRNLGPDLDNSLVSGVVAVKKSRSGRKKAAQHGDDGDD